MRKKKKPRKVVSFRMTESELSVIAELKNTGHVLGLTAAECKKCTITDWVMLCFVAALLTVLVTELSPKQVHSYTDIAELFVLWSKATRGVKGYGFTTKNKKTRFAYGPSEKSEKS